MYDYITMHRTQITLQLLDSAFGAWSHRGESGAEFVDRVRSGTARRLRSTE